MKRALIVMGAVIGICALGQAFLVGVAVGRSSDPCPPTQASNERQLSRHDQDDTPTPAMAPVRWNE